VCGRSEADVSAMPVKELKAILAAHEVPHALGLEKAELVARVQTQVLAKVVTKYDLLANVCHDSPPGQKKESSRSPLEAGSYRVHVQNKGTEQWYEISDLHVQETMPQLVGLSESYMLIYERHKSAKEVAAAQPVYQHVY
jgi:U4/U6.U5 tri-snRNP-associated protein 2